MSTWPTSWIPAPAQTPNCVSLSPSGPASNGKSTTAVVPNRITIAMAAATSSSSARAGPRIAAIAEPPLVAKAVPRSSRLPWLRPIRLPSQVVNNSVLTMLMATTAISGSPSATMEAKDTEKPSSTMPTCNSFRLNIPTCVFPARGSTPMFPANVPSRWPSSGSRPGAPAADRPARHPSRARERREPVQRPAKKQRVASRRQRSE